MRIDGSSSAGTPGSGRFCRRAVARSRMSYRSVTRSAMTPPAALNISTNFSIADIAVERKTGARGLRTIVESVLLDTMYDLPSAENVSKVVVDESVIEHKSEPYLIYQTPAAPEQKAAGAE
mgnify:CR=1 FL=1